MSRDNYDKQRYECEKYARSAMAQQQAAACGNIGNAMSQGLVGFIGGAQGQGVIFSLPPEPNLVLLLCD